MSEQNNRASFTHHNYGYYNEAVNLNIEKQNELVRITKYKRFEHVFKMGLYTIILLCVIALTAAIILKILGSSSAIQTPIISHNKEALAKDTSNLKELIKSQQKEKPFGVTSKFNIFNTQYMGSGEAVITSKEFLPTNLEKPRWQYCYIGNKKTGQIKTILATQKGDEFTVKTKDEYLLKHALPLCTFQKN